MVDKRPSKIVAAPVEPPWKVQREDSERRRMRILITGNMGYVGPVLTRFLRENLTDSELIGFDAGFFGHSLTGAGLLPEALLDRQVFGDIRELSGELLEDVDAVVHL